jgi:hypothetical protein
MGTMEARIMAVTFYGSSEKYLIVRMEDSKVTEEWFPEEYFTVGKTKKIGFDL